MPFTTNDSRRLRQLWLIVVVLIATAFAAFLYEVGTDMGHWFGHWWNGNPHS